MLQKKKDDRGQGQVRLQQWRKALDWCSKLECGRSSKSNVAVQVRSEDSCSSKSGDTYTIYLNVMCLHFKCHLTHKWTCSHWFWWSLGKIKFYCIPRGGSVMDCIKWDTDNNSSGNKAPNSSTISVFFLQYVVLHNTQLHLRQCFLPSSDDVINSFNDPAQDPALPLIRSTQTAMFVAWAVPASIVSPLQFVIAS